MATSSTLFRGRPVDSTGVTRGLKSAARQILVHRSLGRPASTVLRVLGADTLGQKIDKLCGYVPPRVSVRIPARIAGDVYFMIDSDHGRDQAAAALWWKGWGGYEGLVTSLFAGFAKEAECVVDVGANTGLFSLIAAACSATSTIHAFEPFPLCQKLLAGNLKLNHFQSRVRIQPLALSDQDGQMNLYVPLQDHGLDETSCSLNGSFRPEHSQVLPVKVTTLDGYCEQSNLEKIDLLKIDVETHEPQVMRGAGHVFRDHRPVIFIEVLACADLRALNDLTAEHHYTPICLTDTRLEIAPRVEYRPGYINHLFCPTEKLPAVRTTASRIGYQTVKIL